MATKKVDPEGQAPRRVDPERLGAAWTSFVDANQLLLVPDVDNRPLDQFLPFRDEVLLLVRAPEFVRELIRKWPRGSIGEVLLLETEALRRAVEVSGAAAKSESEKRSWRKPLLDGSSTVVGSVKDLVAVSPKAKGVMTLFKEAIDLFKGG